MAEVKVKIVMLKGEKGDPGLPTDDYYTKPETEGLLAENLQTAKDYTDGEIEKLPFDDYYTKEQSNANLQAAVDEAKEYTDNEIATFDFIKIVTELPATGLPNRTYFVPKSDPGTSDLYDEYMWVNGAWEFVGTKTIEVDLTNYVQKDDYATYANRGVVKSVRNYGLQFADFSTNPGALLLADATEAGIKGKVTRGQAGYGALTPSNIQYLPEALNLASVTTNTNRAPTLSDVGKVGDIWIRVETTHPDDFTTRETCTAYMCVYAYDDGGDTYGARYLWVSIASGYTDFVD